MSTLPARERNRQPLIQIFWLCFVLLILAGALREWAFSSLWDPLLPVRDLVAAAILFVAFRDGPPSVSHR